MLKKFSVWVAYQFVDIRFFAIVRTSMRQFLFSFNLFFLISVRINRMGKIEKKKFNVSKLNLPWNLDQWFVFWMSPLSTMFPARCFSFLHTWIFYWKTTIPNKMCALSKIGLKMKLNFIIKWNQIRWLH